jgi:hypothetical protein
MKMVTVQSSLSHTQVPFTLRSAPLPLASAKPYCSHTGLPSENLDLKCRLLSLNTIHHNALNIFHKTERFGGYQSRTTNWNRRPHRCPSTPATSTAATAPPAPATATPALLDPPSGTASTTRRPRPTARSRRTTLPSNSPPSRAPHTHRSSSHRVPPSSPLPQGHPNVRPSCASRALLSHHALCPAPQSPRHSKPQFRPACPSTPRKSPRPHANPTSAGPATLTERERRPAPRRRTLQSMTAWDWARAGRGRWRRRPNLAASEEERPWLSAATTKYHAHRHWHAAAAPEAADGRRRQTDDDSRRRRLDDDEGASVESITNAGVPPPGWAPPLPPGPCPLPGKILLPPLIFRGLCSACPWVDLWSMAARRGPVQLFLLSGVSVSFS